MGRARPFGPSSPRGLLAGLVLLGAAAASLACEQTVTFERSDGGDVSGAGVCPGGQVVNYAPESPVAIVALDRSTSMQDPFGPTGSLSKLDAARQALVTAVQKYQSAVRYGYVGFPGTATSGCFSDECCSYIAPSIPGSGFGGAQLFEQAIYACNDPKANCIDGPQRPTADALMSCQGFFSASDPQVRHRYVLLVTDGDPGCAGTSMDACRAAQTQAMTLANPNTLDVGISVIGLGPPATDDCISQLPLIANGMYYPTRPGDLDSTLNQVMRDIASDACKLDIDPRSLSTTFDPMHVHLYQSGTDVMPGSNTWSFDSNGGRVILHGSTCDSFLFGEVTTALYDCGTASGPHH